MTIGSFGKCYIYNCEDFKEKEGNVYPEDHVDGSTDVEKIRTAFVLIGYDTIVFNNPGSTKIINSLKEFAAEDHGKESSFVCFILSHGGKDNKIYTSDCECIQLETLIDIADADDLQGKPKIFVVQTCRGGQKDRGETRYESDNAREINKDKSGLSVQLEDNVSLITTRPDFLIVFPTSPNYVSWCAGHCGSWFIDMFTASITKYRDKSTVTELLQRLTFSVNCLPISYKNTWYLQVPCYTSTLRKPLLLSKSGLPTNNDVKLQIQYTEEDCYRTRVQALLQHAAEIQVPIYDAEYDNPNSIGYSDYCYLIDESSGCYDTRRNRMCIVINANTDETAFSNGKTDTENKKYNG